MPLDIRPLDELARLWDDTQWRIRQCPRALVVVAVLLASAVIGSALSLASMSSTGAPVNPTASTSPALSASPALVAKAAECEQQAWPYLEAPCLRRAAAPGHQAVRVVAFDADAAAAAVGATPWAAQAVHGDIKMAKAPRGKRTADDRKQRNGRHAAPQRKRQGPTDSAFRAYGFAPRAMPF